jgi:hypothetical protein
VADQQHGSGEGVEGLFDLLDGRQVEMVGRLVEHQAVAPDRHEQRQHQPRAFAGGERRHRSVHMFGADTELGQQCTCLADDHAGCSLERGKRRFIADKLGAGLFQPTELHRCPEPLCATAQGDVAQQRVEQG